ncbi:ABC transporter ATP-binding protein [Pseudohongiella spirulinae]|uniref:ABC transporter-like protein n=1 Tax=Pseudohongiella spirulinae TaxID=1249552 RepID=A0A0S2KF42_9GAMM|nr:ABC transporter ATP-binding protein [Pseudohongiella spirulinae]ALO46906.1 ABC transporter-like protein [Pseudohongiella spirulinae]
MPIGLSVHDLLLATPSQALCGPMSFSLQPGDRLAVLGQNGTGKTTLLHTLAGLGIAGCGQLLLQPENSAELDVTSLSPQQRASRIGIVFQHEAEQMPASVYESVMLGRLPHARRWQWESETDHQVVRNTLEQLELQALADRDLASLSGGEKQRVAIAALLAQQPDIYLLDEPSNHLDIAFQLKILGTLAERVRNQQQLLVMATHDINLANRFCNRVLLLTPDGQHHFGHAKDILQSELLSRAFNCAIESVDTSIGRFFIPQV